MTVAHLAGLPFEEWLGPIAMTGGGIALAIRELFRGRRRR
jgi:hypothetical protein